MRMRRVVALTALVLAPAIAYAQTGGVIAGVVRDASGGVMPGVTIEATSPALIEKVRSAVSDGSGQYKIVDLPPGAYLVTFTLTGFSTVKREGITLSAGFTATVNADLSVGNLEETIIVSGAAPLVDVQNTRQQTTMTRDVIDVLPIAKSAQSFATFVPGVIATSQDVGGSVADRIPTLRIHGSRSSEMPLLYDGMRVNNMNATPGGGHLMWGQNAGAVQEYTVEVGALSAEADVSGVRENAVPKSGGNVFHGTLFTDVTGRILESTGNVADLSQATWSNVIWDFNPAMGGPIKQDKLWYFGAFRYWGNIEHPPGTYYNTNPLGSLVYKPNLDRPAYNKVWGRSFDGRVTWQVNAKNKVSIMGDNMQRCWCKWGLSATTDPNAAGWMRDAPNFVGQVTWNSPITNRLLLEAGYTTHPESWGRWPQPYLPFGIFGVTESSTGITFNAGSNYTQHRTSQFNGKFIATYVTGSHAFKVGFQEMHGWRSIDNWTQGTQFSITVLNGVPRSVTEYAYPYSTRSDVGAYDGIFAMDQWTISKMTLNLGVRMDWLNSSVPAQTYAATLLVDARSFPRVENAPNWKDINPRVGVAYDLFGNGKTALKFTAGRFIQAITTAYSDQASGIVASVNSTTRTWTDTDLDGYPDCDLRNLQPNRECRAVANSNFGSTNIDTTYDPKFLKGWGKRPYDWELQTGLQHQLRSGVSVSATYVRHWWGNFLVQDDLSTKPSDFSSYCVTAPVNSRLPNGGGYELCGFTDINPNKFGMPSNSFVTFAKNYGKQTDVFTGVDLGVNVRLPHGVLVQGGTSTGREVFDNCDVAGKVETPAGGPTDIQTSGIGTPLLSTITGLAGPSKLFCHVAPPFQTQVKLTGAYPLRWGMTASASYQTIPGRQITASYTVPSSQIAASLGRDLSAGPTATARVQLVGPGQMYGDRLHQLDVRVSKNLALGQLRVQPQFAIYNLLNAGPILGYNNTFGPNWLNSTSSLIGRMFKFGTQVDW
jgi:hypothetical protein